MKRPTPEEITDVVGRLRVMAEGTRVYEREHLTGEEGTPNTDALLQAAWWLDGAKAQRQGAGKWRIVSATFDVFGQRHRRRRS